MASSLSPSSLDSNHHHHHQQQQQQILSSCHVHVLFPPLSSYNNNKEKEEDNAPPQKLNFIQWNNNNNTTSSSHSPAFTTTTCVKLTRPNTTLTKSYTVDGIFPSSSCYKQYYQNYIQPQVKESLEQNVNLLLWTFGTRGTGKTRVLFGSDDEEEKGWIGSMASDIHQAFFETTTKPLNDDDENWNVVVAVSSICVTADAMEQAFDCLSLPSSTIKPLSRLRQDANTHEFYFENSNSVIVSSQSDIEELLVLARDFGIGLGKRVHHLVTFTVYKVNVRNGDAVRFTVQIMDVCGAERPSSTTVAATITGRGRGRTTKPAAQRKRQIPQKKEDKTLRALTRIIDSLSNQDKHVPYRDSKLTRLVSHSLGKSNEKEEEKSINIALIGVSAMTESMYDETCAMMEFVNKVRSIEEENKSKTKSAVDGVATVVPRRITNRLQELEQAQQKATDLSQKCGFDVDQQKDLKAEDIELDMSSSMDLVELRDALAKVELLQVDPMEVMVEKSNQWWKDFRRGE